MISSASDQLGAGPDAAPPLIAAIADLSIAIDLDTLQPAWGDEVRASIVLRNSGPDSATGVSVAIEVLDGLVIQSATASDGAYAEGLWLPPNLEAGEEVELNAQLLAVAGAVDYDAVVRVIESDQVDSDSSPGNDAAAEDDQQVVTVSPIGTPVFSVSGTIHAPIASVIDSDVNDPDAPYADNSSFAAAQSITSPETVSGYVNMPSAGSQGRSYSVGDVHDYFAVTLAEGEVVELAIAGDGATNDLDLFLFQADDSALHDSSASVRPYESVTAEVAGDYVVHVKAYGGASNYILSTGKSAATPMAQSVPGELIVHFDPSAVQDSGGSAALAGSLGLEHRRGGDGRESLVSFPAVSGGPSATLVAKALARRPEIVSASPNYLVRPLSVPNDPLYPQQWHYPHINLPAAWDAGIDASNMIVAVVDTGVFQNHPDLDDVLVPGYDFVSDPVSARDGDGIDPNPEDMGTDESPGLSDFHGTHVAGTIAAESNNGIGVAGIATGAKIMPVRVLGLSGSTYDIMQGVRFAAGLPNDSGTLPERRAHVINLSLGGGAHSQEFAELINEVRGLGIVVVAAAGNDNNSVLFYPASYPGVISVSAVRMDNAKASYSSYGVAVDVAAPGGDWDDQDVDGNDDSILSTVANDESGVAVHGYDRLPGTSMAAPHVAGVVALMRAARPQLTPQDIDDILRSGAITTDVGEFGRDDIYGHGVIDAEKAVTQALSYQGGAALQPEPLLVAAPAALNFYTERDTLSFETSNSGEGQLDIYDVTDDAAWLSIGARVEVDDKQRYEVSVDRSGLSDGVYFATIRIRSSSRPVAIPVYMQVGEGFHGNAGRLYLELADEGSGQSVGQVTLEASEGRYDFHFDNVPYGDYQVLSSSDRNFDLQLCDDGEACASYPEAGASFRVDRHVTLELDALLSIAR